MKSKKGFTLIELMITVGVIGTLATIATAQYSNYTAKAQVTEAVLMLERAKSVALEYQHEKGDYPRTEQLQELMPQSKTTELVDTKYLNLITTNQSDSTRYYDINLRFKKERINSNLSFKHLTFRYTYASKSWTCISDDVKQDYLPNVCKGI